MVNSLTLRKVPRRMRRWVMPRNQHSTMLSQELPVGMRIGQGCDYGSWGGWRSRVPSSVKSTGAEGPGGWGT